MIIPSLLRFDFSCVDFSSLSGVNSGYVLKTATKSGFASQQIKCLSEP